MKVVLAALSPKQKAFRKTFRTVRDEHGVPKNLKAPKKKLSKMFKDVGKQWKVDKEKVRE